MDNSGTCFGCCLFKSRLYPWDQHRFQAGWGQGVQGKEDPEPAVFPAVPFPLFRPMPAAPCTGEAGPGRPCRQAVWSSPPPASLAAGQSKKEKEARGGAIPCSFPSASLCDPLCNLSQLPLPGPAPTRAVSNNILKPWRSLSASNLK